MNGTFGPWEGHVGDARETSPAQASGDEGVATASCSRSERFIRTFPEQSASGREVSTSGHGPTSGHRPWEHGSPPEYGTEPSRPRRRGRPSG